jgi:hypothetical protein
LTPTTPPIIDIITTTTVRFLWPLKWLNERLDNNSWAKNNHYSSDNNYITAHNSEFFLLIDC